MTTFKKVLVAGLLSVITTSTLTACSSTTFESGKIQIVASTSTWADVAIQIGGDAVEVVALIDDVNKDPHSFEASARDQLAVNNADIVIANGGGYDDFMNSTLRRARGGGYRDQIAAAWDSGQVDAAFIWEPVQNQILQTGTFIVGADQTAAWGYPTFDGWVVNAEFAAANADAMVAFAKTMNEANLAYLADPAAWTPDSDAVKKIAEMTGAAPDQVPGILKGFTFIPLVDQLGPTWMGGAAANMKTTADFLVKAGRIDAAVDDYSAFVNTSIAEAAK